MEIAPHPRHAYRRIIVVRFGDNVVGDVTEWDTDQNPDDLFRALPNDHTMTAEQREAIVAHARNPG